MQLQFNVLLPLPPPMGLAGTGAGAPLPSRGTDLSYRGFRLRQQPGGFSTPPSSLADVKALIDGRLDQAA
jgi:hypothetical protein